MMTSTLMVTTPNDTDIVMTRTFNAPRQRIFDCWTKPELIRRWLFGPDGWHFTVCEVDLRVGGRYRYVWGNDAGERLGLGGAFQEIAAPERLVCTERFEEEWDNGEAVSTLVLTEEDGRTTLVNTVRSPSKEIRDAMLGSGMADGVAASYDRLEAYLAAN